MPNAIWRWNESSYFAYTEDPEAMRKIKRSYRDFLVVAEYFRGGNRFAVQYCVPRRRLRSIKRLLSVGAVQN